MARKLISFLLPFFVFFFYLWILCFCCGPVVRSAFAGQCDSHDIYHQRHTNLHTFLGLADAQFYICPLLSAFITAAAALLPSIGFHGDALIAATEMQP